MVNAMDRGVVYTHGDADEGRGTSARIDFGGVLEMTGPMKWNDRLVRIAHRPRLASGRKHAFVFGNCDCCTVSQLTIADLADLSDMRPTSVAGDSRAGL
jgi:hypothetical protein